MRYTQHPSSDRIVYVLWKWKKYEHGRATECVHLKNYRGKGGVNIQRKKIGDFHIKFTRKRYSLSSWSYKLGGYFLLCINQTPLHSSLGIENMHKCKYKSTHPFIISTTNPLRIEGFGLGLVGWSQFHLTLWGVNLYNNLNNIKPEYTKHLCQGYQPNKFSQRESIFFQNAQRYEVVKKVTESKGCCCDGQRLFLVICKKESTHPTYCKCADQVVFYLLSHTMKTALSCRHCTLIMQCRHLTCGLGHNNTGQGCSHTAAVNVPSKEFAVTGLVDHCGLALSCRRYNHPSRKHITLTRQMISTVQRHIYKAARA